MQIMYDRDMKLLGAAGSIIAAKAVRATEVEDEDKSKLLFELHLLINGSVEGGAKWAKLVTSHNKPRLFPNLNFLYLLVSDSCPTIEYIQVAISRN